MSLAKLYGGKVSNPVSQEIWGLIKQLALGAVKYPDDHSVSSYYLSQHIYHVVYLSSKVSADCTVDIEIDRQKADWGVG